MDTVNCSFSPANIGYVKMKKIHIHPKRRWQQKHRMSHVSLDLTTCLPKTNFKPIRWHHTAKCSPSFLLSTRNYFAQTGSPLELHDPSQWTPSWRNYDIVISWWMTDFHHVSAFNGTRRRSALQRMFAYWKAEKSVWIQMVCASQRAEYLDTIMQRLLLCLMHETKMPSTNTMNSCYTFMKENINLQLRASGG